MRIISKIFQRGAAHFSSWDPWVRRVYGRIAECGSGELGTSTFRCTNCQKTETFGAGCGSRNCPSCGAAARAKWVEKSTERLFPVKHFHAVFTLPHQLNPLIAQHQKPMLDLLMKCVGATLSKFSEKTLKGKPAFMMVLHTWTQTLEPHYHVHVLIAAGAFSDGKWRPHTKDFLFPIRALSKVFRAKFLEGLLSMTNDLKNPLYGIKLPPLPERWNVYCAAPYNGAQTAVKYFGKYANRVGISDSRILNVTDTEVTIALKRDKNDRDPENNNPSNPAEKKKRTLVLTIAEFISRFITHILPRGFCKIRYGGVYAGRSKERAEIKKSLSKANTSAKKDQEPNTFTSTCKFCDVGQMVFAHRSRAPPERPP
jgi:Putative transposase/Transposase zinc-binding domain